MWALILEYGIENLLRSEGLRTKVPWKRAWEDICPRKEMAGVDIRPLFNFTKIFFKTFILVKVAFINKKYPF